MKTIVLLGVLVLLLLFLNWKSSEHMTLVKGVPVVEQADLNVLLPLWSPDPAALQKEKDDGATVTKAAMCALNNGHPDVSRGMRNGSPGEQLVRATAYIAANNC